MCNVNNRQVAKSVYVKAGDKVTIEWHHDKYVVSFDFCLSDAVLSNRSSAVTMTSLTFPIRDQVYLFLILGSNEVIEAFLVQVYLAPSNKNDWTKIFSDSFSNGQWAVERLVAAHGQHSIVVPDVPAGDYILRRELVIPKRQHSFLIFVYS